MNAGVFGEKVSWDEISSSLLEFLAGPLLAGVGYRSRVIHLPADPAGDCRESASAPYPLLENQSHCSLVAPLSTAFHSQ
jgi:hypothetical protein